MTQKINSIALLGTSADPPTCGHQIILEGLIKLFPKVITWASDNPIKQHQIALKNRYELLKALVKDIDNPKLSIVQELSSPWTISSLKKASKFWPNSQFTFIIGSDLIEEIPKWVNTRDILKMTRIGIVPREGWAINKEKIIYLKNIGGTIDILPLNIPASSSSNFRKRQEYSQIPNALLPLIIEKNLYNLSNKPL